MWLRLKGRTTTLRFRWRKQSVSVDSSHCYGRTFVAPAFTALFNPRGSTPQWAWNWTWRLVFASKVPAATVVFPAHVHLAECLYVQLSCINSDEIAQWIESYLDFSVTRPCTPGRQVTSGQFIRQCIHKGQTYRNCAFSMTNCGGIIANKGQQRLSCLCLMIHLWKQFRLSGLLLLMG